MFSHALGVEHDFSVLLLLFISFVVKVFLISAVPCALLHFVLVILVLVEVRPEVLLSEHVGVNILCSVGLKFSLVFGEDLLLDLSLDNLVHVTLVINSQVQYVTLHVVLLSLLVGVVDFSPLGAVKLFYVLANGLNQVIVLTNIEMGLKLVAFVDLCLLILDVEDLVFWHFGEASLVLVLSFSLCFSEVEDVGLETLLLALARVLLGELVLELHVVLEDVDLLGVHLVGLVDLLVDVLSSVEHDVLVLGGVRHGLGPFGVVGLELVDAFGLLLLLAVDKDLLLGLGAVGAGHEAGLGLLACVLDFKVAVVNLCKGVLVLRHVKDLGLVDFVGLHNGL